MSSDKINPQGLVDDFTICNHGSLFIVIPETNEAKEWTDRHIPDDAH